MKSAPKNHHKKWITPKSMIAVIILGLIALVFPIPSIDSTKVALPYSQQYTQDSSLELGQQQTRQPGNNGVTLEKKRLVKPAFAHLFGLKLTYTSSDLPSETTVQPINEIIANGTKKYQYMHCSDGTYKYYSNDQFKEPLTGFTHSSPDACAEKGNGHMTALSDVAPQQQTTNTVYRPTYAPTYTSPTHCYTQYNTYGGYFNPTANTTCY